MSLRKSKLGLNVDVEKLRDLESRVLQVLVRVAIGCRDRNIKLTIFFSSWWTSAQSHVFWNLGYAHFPGLQGWYFKIVTDCSSFSRAVFFPNHLKHTKFWRIIFTANSGKWTHPKIGKEAVNKIRKHISEPSSSSKGASMGFMARKPFWPER